MSDPFDPPAADSDRALEASELGWVAATRWTLIFCGCMYGVLGVAGAPLMYVTFVLDPTIDPSLGRPIGVGFGLLTLVICVGFGGVNLLAASGLKRGKKWAWILALVLGGMYAPSGCLPFGVVILYGLLNDRVRRVFLG